MSDVQGQAPRGSSKSKPQWLVLAVGSGAFAATNGVFAKLTTATHTHDLASWISHLFGYEETSVIIEYICRAIFFGLNLLSNAVMWILFTRALTAATSTTRVAILNTSANFMVTAVLGLLIFSEHLPLQWWLGAAFLVAGSVVIGARENKEQPGAELEGGVALEDTTTTTAADTAAVAVGAGGIVEDMAAHGRYKDMDDEEEEHGVLAGPGTRKTSE